MWTTTLTLYCQLKIGGLGSMNIAGHAAIVATSSQGADLQQGAGEVDVLPSYYRFIDAGING